MVGISVLRNALTLGLFLATIAALFYYPPAAQYLAIGAVLAAVGPRRSTIRRWLKRD